jgi:mgtE-like transporter
VALVGGLLAVAFALAVAYYGTIGAVALRVDPDTYGIPVVTSAVDFVGVIALVAAATLFGVTV